VGWLTERNDIWQFEYALEWLQWDKSWDISPPLPRAAGTIRDGSTLRPVQWFFENLLPEDRMRTAIASNADIADADAFALLEYMGAESAGSLVLLPEGALLTEVQNTSPLPDIELDIRIQNMPKVPLASTSPKRMSLAGAQHKLLVNWDENALELSEPIGFTPSTHILKPEHLSEDYPHSVINEYAMMKLAARLGLDAPQVWRHYCPQPVYIVRRFDRDLKGHKRLHVVDTCQLLNKSHLFKYAQANLNTLNQVIQATRNRLATRLSLFRWLIFNVLIGNHDNHLKNLSFFASEEGVTLAPVYDLLSTAVYHSVAYPSNGAKWPDIDLAIPLPSQTHYTSVTHQGLIDAAALLGIPQQVGMREISTFTSHIAAEMDAIIVNIEQENTQLPDETHRYHGGELRLLRSIRYVIIGDMLKKLA
jgi:serine/threonine-protein kinase HipA